MTQFKTLEHLQELFYDYCYYFYASFLKTAILLKPYHTTVVLTVELA